ncbi:MAG: glutamine-hydrolyzing carbamoyl-phosphate synthase small subunit [Planctomycetia bacterium]|nr:glutamine-hydrolyzing carbamoyl-phosphate synthase small subunit [Planctomycetia bacterium]
MTSKKPALLVLADGTTFRGTAFGAIGERTGEVVFNTSMSGYQEIATDPSYTGQIVCLTYPLIGNYGVNLEDPESARPWIEGLIVRELSPVVSNYRSSGDLDAYLRAAGIVGIEGIDTRRLVRRLRVDGCVNGILSSGDVDPASLLRKAKAAPDMNGLDLVKVVSTATSSAWGEGFPKDLPSGASVPAGAKRYPVVAMDFGMKRNILRGLVANGFDPWVVPATTSAAAILERKPAGVFLSNGPGDPAAVTYAIQTIKALLGKVPVFGICLGHQMMALAAGAKTYKLKFGHRGGNQPVLDHDTGKVEITSQNHGFAVDVKSLERTGFRATHTNLNDDTNEGIASEALGAFAVQYHPEAAPGPHDAVHLFGRFRRLVETGKLTPAEPVAASK